MSPPRLCLLESAEKGRKRDPARVPGQQRPTPTPTDPPQNEAIQRGQHLLNSPEAARQVPGAIHPPSRHWMHLDSHHRTAGCPYQASGARAKGKRERSPLDRPALSKKPSWPGHSVELLDGRGVKALNKQRKRLAGWHSSTPDAHSHAWPRLKGGAHMGVDVV